MFLLFDSRDALAECISPLCICSQKWAVPENPSWFNLIFYDHVTTSSSVLTISPNCLTKAKQEYLNKYIVFQKGFNSQYSPKCGSERIVNLNFCGDVSLFLSLVKRTAYFIGGFHLFPPQSNVFCSFFSRDFYISQGLKIYLVICNNTKEISHGNPRKWMSNFTRMVKTLLKFWKSRV